jgi:hypothetical protein
MEAFNLIDNVCNLNFNFLNDGNINAEILLWETSDDEVLGIALHGPSDNAQYGLPGDTFVDVFAGTSVLNYESNFASNLGKGSDAFYTWIHEIGHALGLGHPHDTGFGSNIISGYTGDYQGGNSGLNYGLNTVMSYNAYADDHWTGLTQGNESAATGHSVLGAWDIYALQQKYGVNTNYNTELAFDLGCQFVAMEFQHIDSNMDYYITLFKTRSMVMKDDDLLAGRTNTTRPMTTQVQLANTTMPNNTTTTIPNRTTIPNSTTMPATTVPSRI